jgi:hypothetical protein
MHPSEALSPRDVFGARVTAAVLDLALVALAAGPLAGAAGWGFALAFSFVYLGVIQGFTGWSLSKAILGVRVVKVGTTAAGGPISGVIRWLLAPLGVPVVSAISSAFNDRRRGVGDIAGRTEVVGLAPAPRVRVLAAIGYIAAVGVFVAASTLNTFLIVFAIFLPMVIAGLVVVLGQRRMPGGVMWLAGLGFAFVAACLMSFQGLCKKGGGTCADLDFAHKAIPALVVLVIAIVVLFTLRGMVMYAAVAALTAIAEIWMFIRLRKDDDMAFGALLMLILLAAALLGEGIRISRKRAQDRDDVIVAAEAAAAGR